MVELVLVVEVKEGYLETVKEQIKILSQKTVQEAGCILYRAYFSTNNENTICFVEQWETQEAIDQHLASDHIKEYRTNTADMFVSRNLNFLERII